MYFTPYWSIPVIGQIQSCLSNYNLLRKKEIGPIVENIVKVENVVYVIVVNFQICTAL